MGELRMFGELVEAGGAIESGSGGGGGFQGARVVRTAGDYQTTSTSFVDIDGNNLVINLTTGASWVMLLLLGSGYTAGLQYECFDFTIDGMRQGNDNGVQYSQPYYLQDLQIVWLMQVTAGSHVFKPQWRGTGVTCYLRASQLAPLVFAVIEMS
ncbi:MAG: hypothetical protein ABSC13_02855 [Dehalococcoidia bacterium]|jgi:hypothetical protein